MKRILCLLTAVLLLGAGCVESRATRDEKIADAVASTRAAQKPKTLIKKFVFQKEVGVVKGDHRQYPFIDILTSDIDGSNMQTIVHKVGGLDNYPASLLMVPTRNMVVLNTEHTITAYDLMSGIPKKILEGDATNSYIFSETLSKDEKSLYFARFKGSYAQTNVPVELYEYIFETEKLNLLATIPPERVDFGVVSEMVFSPDRSKIYLETGTASEQPPQLRVFDMRSKKITTIAEGLQSTLLVSNDGTKMAYSLLKKKSLLSYINEFSGSFEATEVRVLHLGDNVEESMFESGDDIITPIKWSPDASQLLLATDTPIVEQPFCPNDEVINCCKKGTECPLGVVASKNGYGLFSFGNGTLTPVLDPNPLQKQWDTNFVEFGRPNEEKKVAFTLDKIPFYDQSLRFIGSYFVEK